MNIFSKNHTDELIQSITSITEAHSKSFSKRTLDTLKGLGFQMTKADPGSKEIVDVFSKKVKGTPVSSWHIGKNIVVALDDGTFAWSYGNRQNVWTYKTEKDLIDALNQAGKDGMLEDTTTGDVQGFDPILMSKMAKRKDLEEGKSWKKHPGEISFKAPADIPDNFIAVGPRLKNGDTIVNRAPSYLGGGSEFLVVQKKAPKGDKFYMVAVSTQRSGAKRLAYYGTHPSADGAMKMAKNQELIESTELEEASLTFKKMSDKQLIDWLKQNDSDEPGMSPVFGAQLLRAKKEAKSRNLVWKESTELEEMKAGEGLFKKTSDIDDITTESIPGSGGVLKISDLEIDGEKPNVTKTWKYGVRVGGGYRFFVTLQGAKKFAKDDFDESTELTEETFAYKNLDAIKAEYKDHYGEKIFNTLKFQEKKLSNGKTAIHITGIGKHGKVQQVAAYYYDETDKKTPWHAAGNAFGPHASHLKAESTELEEARKPKEGDMVIWSKKGSSRQFAVASIDKNNTAWIADDDGEEYEANIRDLKVVESFEIELDTELLPEDFKLEDLGIDESWSGTSYSILEEDTEELEEALPKYEDVISQLQAIKAFKQQRVKTSDGKKFKVDPQTANAILTVYKALNDTNKKKMELMLGVSRVGFNRVADFAWQNVSAKGI